MRRGGGGGRGGCSGPAGGEAAGAMLCCRLAALGARRPLRPLGPAAGERGELSREGAAPGRWGGRGEPLGAAALGGVGEIKGCGGERGARWAPLPGAAAEWAAWGR